MPIPELTRERRPFCDRCLRPQTACFCADLRPVEPGFDLVILQHPKERKKTTASARMAHLSVRTSTLIQGVELDLHPEVIRRLRNSALECVVLFPGEGALKVDQEEGRDELAKRACGKRLVVFVIDGTWSTARTLLGKSPCIAGLPCIAFTPEKESEYGFKKQPARFCLSTVEAIHQLIRILDPALDVEPMMRVFRAMVERQLAYTAPIPDGDE